MYFSRGCKWGDGIANRGKKGQNNKISRNNALVGIVQLITYRSIKPNQFFHSNWNTRLYETLLDYIHVVKLIERKQPFGVLRCKLTRRIQSFWNLTKVCRRLYTYSSISPLFQIQLWRKFMVLRKGRFNIVALLNVPFTLSSFHANSFAPREIVSIFREWNLAN